MYKKGKIGFLATFSGRSGSQKPKKQRMVHLPAWRQIFPSAKIREYAIIDQQRKNDWSVQKKTLCTTQRATSISWWAIAIPTPDRSRRTRPIRVFAFCYGKSLLKKFNINFIESADTVLKPATNDSSGTRPYRQKKWRTGKGYERTLYALFCLSDPYLPRDRLSRLPMAPEGLRPWQAAAGRYNAIKQNKAFLFLLTQEHHDI